MVKLDSIESSGFPLGFKVASGRQRARVLGSEPAREVFVVESRMLQKHQREGVVHEGGDGSRWRLTCDEGKHLEGSDLAPFPLGFFNAGLHSDLMGRIIAEANARSLEVDDVEIDLQNHYWMTGSFFRGTGQGFADPATVVVKLRSSADASAVRQLVESAIKASPAMAAMRSPLTNTFALYPNGRRRSIEELAPSTASNAADPYITYSSAPKPLPEWSADNSLIRKTGQVAEGEITPAPVGTDTRILRNIRGHSTLLDKAGIVETDTVLGLPGMSHFAIKSDERMSGDAAPCGLSLQAAGIAFCFMTQLGRYIEHMKFDIEGIRVVQYSPYAIDRDGDGTIGIAEPVDTHLFLNGRADEEDFAKLMHIAARTCYLHACLGAALEPNLAIELNGAAI